MDGIATSATDAFVADVARTVATRMTATGLSGADLRERIHLDPYTKDACERRTGARPLSQKLRTPDFPGLGAVDVVLSEPRALIELKWAYQSPGKIFESLWDAIKLALLGSAQTYPALYLATGASLDEWKASESAELFEPGEVDPAELWGRALIPPRGPNYGRTVGDDLVIGAHGNRPVRVHRRIAVRSVARAPVADGYELRVIAVTGMEPLVGWSYPPTQPPAVEPALLKSVQLPSRVTQSWIERTAPRLAPLAIAPFLRDLRQRGWSDADIAERVMPHLQRQ